MQQSACPSEEQLLAFQLGNLPQASLKTVTEHLQSCNQCQARTQHVRPHMVADWVPPTLAPARSNQTEGERFTPPPSPVPATPFSFLLPPAQPDEIGRLGNYRVLRLLDRGGMGFVFQAEDIALHRAVALKVMNPELYGHPEGCQRFLREARIMASIKHEHLVTVFQVGQEDKVIYLAMELLHGESLAQWQACQGTCAPAEVLRLGREIASGLAVIHRHGLVHRDIKPANIWLEAPTARVKILDFGLARAVKDNSKLTQTGAIMGTPSFMSPEQARGEAVDGRSDLFSLGCVLYSLCTGREPFQAETTMGVLTALATHAPPPVQVLNPAMPRGLSELVMQLLAKDPAERPASAEVVLERLQELTLDPNPSPAATCVLPSTAAAAAPPKPRQRPRWATLGLAIGVVGLLSLTALYFFPDLLSPFVVAPTEDTGPRIYLTELTPVSKENWPFTAIQGPGKKLAKELIERKLGKQLPGFGELKPVSVAGKVSPHGIFMHPPPPPQQGRPASISYQLEKQYRTFKTVVTLNDGPPRSDTPLTFSVYGDGQLLWKSQPVHTQGDSQTVHLSVGHVDILKIEVICPGEVHGAHAVWVEPYLTQ